MDANLPCPGGMAMPCWLALPSDVLLQHVFPHVAACDKASLRLVNKHTEAVVNASVVRLHLDLSAAAVPGIATKFPHVTSLQVKDTTAGASSHDLCFASLLAACRWPRLSTLNLTTCLRLASPTLRAALAAFPSVSTLHLPSWTDDLMLTATTSLTTLNHLHLGSPHLDSRLLTTHGLTALTTHHRHTLRTLALPRCTALTDPTLSVALPPARAIRTLDLSRTLISAPALRPLAHHPTLHTLILNSCHKINDEALATLSPLPALTRLELHHTPLSTSSLAPLTPATHPRLAHLSLGPRFTLHSATAAPLARLTALTHLSFGTLCANAPIAAALPHLRSLEFGGLHRNYGVEHLLPLPGLRSLSLRGIETASPGVLAHAARHSTLTSLHLAGAYHLPDSGLRQLALVSTLRHLSLVACPGVTLEALAAVASANAGLKELEAFDCPLLPPCVAAIRSTLPAAVREVTLGACAP